MKTEYYAETYTEKANRLADEVVAAAKSFDRVAHWKAVHKLLRHQNKKARQEQDQIAKECKEIRQEKIFKKTPSSKMGLRFGVSMPPMTWNALVEADILAYSKSVLTSPDKEDHTDLKATNSIVKDLEKAFPQYRVS